MSITVQLSDALFNDLAASLAEIKPRVRLAATIDLYSRGLLSQARGAEIAGLNRWDFIQALGHAEVPACQVTAEELQQEAERAYQAHLRRVVVDSPDQGRTD